MLAVFFLSKPIIGCLWFTLFVLRNAQVIGINFEHCSNFDIVVLHLSCHCSNHLCHCIRVHRHLHPDRSDQTIHQCPNHTEQKIITSHLPTIIQSLHPLLATQQRGIIIELFLNIDAFEAILFELWLINVAIFRLGGCPG